MQINNAGVAIQIQGLDNKNLSFSLCWAQLPWERANAKGPSPEAQAMKETFTMRSLQKSL